MIGKQKAPKKLPQQRGSTAGGKNHPQKRRGKLTIFDAKNLGWKKPLAKKFTTREFVHLVHLGHLQFESYLGLPQTFSV